MLIANVQESLARTARYQPNTRFDDLFSLVAHPHVLWVAAEAVLHTAGAGLAGVDGVTGADFGRFQAEHALRLSAELKAGAYRPGPVRRLTIPRAGGALRPVGLPSIRDRVVQEAVRMVLEPIFESHFLSCSLGFRPGRRTMDAAHLIARFADDQHRMWWVVAGEIRGCFETIPQRRLLGALRRYIKDRALLALIQQLLGAGILEQGTVARPNAGVLQSGVLAPLLVNVYLHELDRVWWERYGGLDQSQQAGRREAGLGNVQLLRYADELVLLTDGDKAFAHRLRDEVGAALAALGLDLAQASGPITHINDGFDYLGFNFRRVSGALPSRHLVLITPSAQSIARFKQEVATITSRSSIGADPLSKLHELNALIRGWAGYYRYVNAAAAFRHLERYVHWRMYRWLKAKHSAASAHSSVRASVVRNYRARRGKRHVWGLEGVTLASMTSMTRRRYALRWPADGNPYLSRANQLVTSDDVPLVAREHSWRGFSALSAYAVERQRRMEQVGHSCEECGATARLRARYHKPQQGGGDHTAIDLQILCELCYSKAYSGNVPAGSS